MQTRSSDENSIRLFVCLSVVRRVNWDKTEEKSVQIFIPHERSYPSFLRKKEWLVGATRTWNFGSSGPGWSEIADFEPIIARSALAVTSSEKSSINSSTQSMNETSMRADHSWVEQTALETQSLICYALYLKKYVIQSLEFSEPLPWNGDIVNDSSESGIVIGSSSKQRRNIMQVTGAQTDLRQWRLDKSDVRVISTSG